MGLALLLGFGVGVATTVFFMTPPPLLAETPSKAPSAGTLHRHENSWWRVEEVFAQEAIVNDQTAAGRYQAQLRAGKLTHPPDENSQEKTVYLVLSPMHPPLGMMMTRELADHLHYLASLNQSRVKPNSKDRLDLPRPSGSDPCSVGGWNRLDAGSALSLYTPILALEYPNHDRDKASQELPFCRVSLWHSA